jgi:precorrin-2 dehydrogenase/sirohydrochlorin ferrochelatase
LEILRAATFPTSHHNMAHHEFPEIKGGGSLILAWQVKNKKVLVIGGGEVSLARC